MKQRKSTGVLSRRAWGAAVLSAAAAPLPAQTAPAAQSPEQLLDAARSTVRRNSESLAQFKIPMSAEPAFQFKA